MKNLLHIIASPRKENSRTLKISNAFLDGLRNRFPDIQADELDLYEEKLPDLNLMRVKGKYMLLSGKELNQEAEESWKEIKAHIERFLAAEVIVFSSPMWNFSLPYRLKHYLDIILQPGFLFKYGENGVEGLAKGKKAIVVTTHGGDYSRGSGAEAFDQLTPYMRQVLGFIGIESVQFVQAQPMDAGGEEVRNKKFTEALKQARELANNFQI
jgi:FMN-dependent NADH-azoreductase